MIEICELKYREKKVFFRWRGLDMMARIYPDYIMPIIILGTAEGCEVKVEFNDYSKLREALDLYVMNIIEKMLNKK